MTVNHRILAALQGGTLNAARTCRCGDSRARIGWHGRLFCTNCGRRTGRLSRAAMFAIHDLRGGAWEPVGVHLRRVLDKLQIDGREA